MRQSWVWKLLAFGTVSVVNEIGITTLSAEVPVLLVQIPTQLSQGSIFKFTHEEPSECSANLDLGFAGIGISPDGKHLAAVIHQLTDETGTNIRVIKRWNLATGKMIPTQIEGVLEGRQSFYHLDDFAFTSDSSTLIGAYGGRTFSNAKGEFIRGAFIKLWDSKTEKEIRSLRVDFDSKSDVSASISLSSDGKTLAWYSAEREKGAAFIKLWSLQTNRLFHDLTLSFPNKNSILYTSRSAISLDNKILATLDRSTITIQNLSTGKPLRTINAGGNVYPIALSVDGKLLFGAKQNGSINVWDATTGQPLRTIDDSAVVSFLSVTSDNKTLLSGANDGSIKLRDITTGKVIRTLCFE